MHELAITKQLIKDIMDVVKEKKIQKVRRVVVQVGKLTSYKVEPMKYYFNNLRKEHPPLSKTIFEGRNVAGEEVLLKEIELNNDVVGSKESKDSLSKRGNSFSYTREKHSLGVK